MQGYPITVEQKVVFRDIDMLGHVNNAVYATFFENARLAYMEALGAEVGGLLPLILAEITITYKTPAYLNEQLVIGVRVAEVRNSSMILESQINEKESDRLVATSRAVVVHFDYAEQRPKPIPESWRQQIATLEETKA